MLSRITTIKGKTFSLIKSMRIPFYPQKMIQKSYSFPGGLSQTILRSFSITTKLPNSQEEVLKIETDPYLYVNIQSNPYQQKVWANKLNIPEEFVNKYFNTIQKLQNADGQSATSFNPSKFGEDTPKSVVKEYLAAIEEGLVKAFEKYGANEELTIADIIKVEGIQTPTRRADMPKAIPYTKTKLTDSEKLQMEYEQDVFESKLNAEADAIIDSLLNSFREASEEKNPLLRDNLKTLNRETANSDLLEYIMADRFLKNDSILLKEDILHFNKIKAKGLSELGKRKEQEYIEQQNEEKLKLSTITNIKIDQILEK